ncbi:hypothetical protein NEIG_01176 [Nematocida sp. ERTm5]|nr:hypothetical protein NEIG_01176 [Nematocida sp. ERTm5]
MDMQNVIKRTKAAGDKLISTAGDAKYALIDTYNKKKEPTLNAIKTGAETVFETSKNAVNHVIEHTPEYIDASKEYTTNNWIPMLIGAGLFLIILIILKLFLLLRKSQ